MIAILGLLFNLVGFCFFAWRRLKRYLHIFQQDEYDGSRFLPWLIQTRTFDKRVSIALVVIAFFTIFLRTPINIFLPGLLFIIFALLEADPTKIAKKPLAMTKRASRVFMTAMIVTALIAIGVARVKNIWLWIILVQVLPITLVLAKTILQPGENRIQRRIREEAQTKLQQINSKIIGITGSFGKTSVKHILGNILGLNARSFFTPGGINTVMGISRIIREQLPTDTEFFVVEMGAYGQGSIKRLCDLTPPSLGIITALGEAHYERFKDLDTVARAKFELADAVLNHPDGKMIVHDSVLKQSYARDFVTAHRDRFIVCGMEQNSDVVISSWEQTKNGLNIVVQWNGQTHSINAPIFGEQHVGNIALSFAAASVLGIAPEYALHALQVTPQIKHRLEIKPQPDGTTYIDDAYNSNEIGFTAALDCLSRVADGKGRRIIVTPGLVELGEKHDDVHRSLGALTAEKADITVVVKPERIPSFLEGFRGKQTSAELKEFGSFKDAIQWVQLNIQSGDVVLLENDLPDLYERKLVL
jgi:UDP-N-acetylmuramoyl-tripeptide--D-alanyl-D-alanine ligase